MTKAELEIYRQRLLALKKRYGGELSTLEEQVLRPTGGEASGGLSDVPLHLADLGTDTYEQEIALSLLKNEEHLVEEINAALARVEEGTFGRCEQCQQEIPRERLEAVPYSRACIVHAQESESRQSVNRPGGE